MTACIAAPTTALATASALVPALPADPAQADAAPRSAAPAPRRRAFPLPRLADLLSGLNLLAGVTGAVLAARGRADLALACLLLGALCDGLDGAAARRFGGSRWGALADDVADAASYAVAPAVALASAVGGIEGAALGAAFGLSTITRLVFFTLNQGNADPRTFWGVPSTVGALIVLAGAVLLPGRTAALGLLAGLAAALMVSFDARHRHLGRALAESAHARRLGLAGAAVVATAALAAGPPAAALLLLTGALGYALWPSAAHLVRVARGRATAPAAAAVRRESQSADVSACR